MAEGDDEREVGETGKKPDEGEPWAKFSSGRDPHEDEDESDGDEAGD